MGEQGGNNPPCEERENNTHHVKNGRITPTMGGEQGVVHTMGGEQGVVHTMVHT